MMAQTELNNPSDGILIDTTIVLFLLMLEIGRSARNLSFETLLVTITALMVMVLPFFLRSFDLGEFKLWLGKRVALAAAAIALGMILPSSLEFVPMALLIPAAMVSCYIQFYSLLRLRLAK